ncbi:MAG: T9SS type A sorting domain-containing protein [Candidatus Kapabacteria bacterium]|nr:T9SS type A sorting domain-containing protein [Candidatus Kapabacteria bacterium]
MKISMYIRHAILIIALSLVIPLALNSQERLTINLSPNSYDSHTIYFIDENNDGFADGMEGLDELGNTVKLKVLDKLGIFKQKNLKVKPELITYFFYNDESESLAMLGYNEVMNYFLIEPTTLSNYYNQSKLIFGMLEIDLTEFPNYSLHQDIEQDFINSDFDLTKQSFLPFYADNFKFDFYLPNNESKVSTLGDQDFEMLYDKDYTYLSDVYDEFYEMNSRQSGIDFDFSRIDFTDFYKSQSIDEFEKLLEKSKMEFNLANVDFASFMKNGFDESKFGVYNIFAFNLNDQDFKHLYCTAFDKDVLNNKREFQLCRQLIEEAIKSQFSAEQLAMLEKFSQIENDYAKVYLRVSPNPASTIANIFYEVETISRIVIRVYSCVGHEEAVILDEYAAPGSKQISFNVSNLSNGVYVLQMIIDSRAFSTRLIVAN